LAEECRRLPHPFHKLSGFDVVALFHESGKLQQPSSHARVEEKIIQAGKHVAEPDQVPNGGAAASAPGRDPHRPSLVDEIGVGQSESLTSPHDPCATRN